MSSTVPAGQFKARCLAILDQVAELGEEVVITKRGKPVARLMPLPDEQPPTLLGSVDYDSEADVLSPVSEPWNADQ